MFSIVDCITHTFETIQKIKINHIHIYVCSIYVIYSVHIYIVIYKFEI